MFTGSVPWEEVPAYTDAGDVFAMPCRTRRFGLEPEAWGIVFLEAQACGLPVVVGRSGGAPETVIPGRGRLVSGVAETAAALVGLLAAPPAREQPTALCGWDAVGITPVETARDGLSSKAESRRTHSGAAAP